MLHICRVAFRCRCFSPHPGPNDRFYYSDAWIEGCNWLQLIYGMKCKKWSLHAPPTYLKHLNYGKFRLWKLKITYFCCILLFFVYIWFNFDINCVFMIKYTMWILNLEPISPWRLENELITKKSDIISFVSNIKWSSECERSAASTRTAKQAAERQALRHSHSWRKNCASLSPRCVPLRRRRRCRS